MRKPSYVGITGFMSQKEVESVLNVLPLSSDRLLMVGVLGSHKTLFQGLQNKWPNRYPKADDVAGAFQKHPLALNLLHYNTKEPETLFVQMDCATKIAGSNFQGFQLNVAWPSPRSLGLYREQHPKMQIVLQVGHGAFEQIGNSPENLARKVASEYIGLVDYLLLDPSGGYGKPFDTERARENICGH